jgi:hypothetical protein
MAKVEKRSAGAKEKYLRQLELEFASCRLACEERSIKGHHGHDTGPAGESIPSKQCVV